MNIPNTITMARLVLTVLVFACLGVMPVAGGEAWAWASLALFLVASGTDWLDGYLARKWDMVTAFGRIADPFADKILVVGTLVMLLQFPAATAVLTHWFVVVMVGREFLVTAIRGYVESAGHAFGADRLGKYKMVAQVVLVAALLALVAGSDAFVWPAIVGYWVSLVLTVVSGLNYCVKARRIILNGGA